MYREWRLNRYFLFLYSFFHQYLLQYMMKMHFMYIYISHNYRSTFYRMSHYLTKDMTSSYKTNMILYQLILTEMDKYTFICHNILFSLIITYYSYNQHQRSIWCYTQRAILLHIRQFTLFETSLMKMLPLILPTSKNGLLWNTYTLSWGVI